MASQAILHCDHCSQPFNAALAQLEPGEGADYFICPHCNSRNSSLQQNLHLDCPHWRDGACYQQPNWSTPCELPSNLNFRHCARVSQDVQRLAAASRASPAT